MSDRIRSRGRGRRWTMLVWAGAALLLAAPLAVMPFTDQVAWTGFDFAVAGLILGGVALAVELTVRWAPDPAYRSGIALAVAASVLLVLVNGAVGIIGSENNSGNGYFGLVLATAWAGAALARLRARGLSYAMTAAAMVQALVPGVAALLSPEARPYAGTPEVLGATVVFAAIWLAAAALFRRSANGADAANPSGVRPQA